MKKLCSVGLVGLTIVLLLTGLCDNPNTFCLLPVEVHMQQQNNWCWAATTQMIMEYLGADPAQVTQCLQASAATSINCCQNTLPAGCDEQGNPDFNFTLNLNVSGVSFDSSGPINLNQTGLTWAKIKNQIHTKKKPFVYARKPAGGSAGVNHIVAVIGYANSGGDKWVLINDPLLSPTALDPDRGTNNSFVKLDDYRFGQEGNFLHWYDIIDITRNSR